MLFGAGKREIWALTHFGCNNNQDDHVTENIVTLALSTHTDNCSNLPVLKKKISDISGVFFLKPDNNGEIIMVVDSGGFAFSEQSFKSPH